MCKLYELCMHARLYMSSRSILRCGLAPVWVSMTCTYGSGHVYIISLCVCVFGYATGCVLCVHIYICMLRQSFICVSSRLRADSTEAAEPLSRCCLVQQQEWSSQSRTSEQLRSVYCAVQDDR